MPPSRSGARSQPSRSLLSCRLFRRPRRKARPSVICREHGVSPKSDGYEYCLSQATRALYWGEPGLARSFARVTANARDACLGYGLQPQTTGFQTCIDRETYARGLMVHADAPPTYGPQIADHP